MDSDNLVGAAQALADKAQEKAREKKILALGEQYAAGQLTLWPESERGIPNELVRCAVFSAKNRKEPRAMFRATAPLVVPVIGGGEVRYTGEELRQDDESVWMELVHMAKESRSPTVTFTPTNLIRSLQWTDSGKSYARLLTTLRRLRSASLEVYSARLGRGVSTGLIVDYAFSDKGDGKPWSVTVFRPESELLFLFDKLYSRVNRDARLALPEGLATWLHSFFSSHREPFSHKIETLAGGAGLTLDVADDGKMSEAELIAKRKARAREVKRMLKKALTELQRVGFLAGFQITSGGLVKVVRANENKDVKAPSTPTDSDS
jgi:hypothetical protein